MKIKIVILLSFCLLLCFGGAMSQELYTARGYWMELNKENYKKVREKKLKGDSLNTNETLYLQDYETYLINYYKRMPEEEKQKYETMKAQWDAEVSLDKPAERKIEMGESYEWRRRDRWRNGFYGYYYGVSLVSILNANEASIVGIPFISAGLWQLGPAINPKKYDGIDYSVMRASNTGKFLGLAYGLAMGLALGGDSEDTGNLALGISTIGSITLGELAFQTQKKKHFSEGHIELMRHYGFLGPGISLLGLGASEVDNANAIGAGLLAGGVAGLVIGNRISKKYDYTVGDVDVISSQTWIYTGLGATLVAGIVDNDGSPGLLMLPAATAIGGTVLAQKMVRGVYLTPEQGKSISLSSGAAALVGVGILTLAGAESVGVWIGVPSGMALITHQIMFQKYKKENLMKKIQLGRNTKNPVQFSMKVTPENYFLNTKQNPDKIYIMNGAPVVSQPIVKLSLTF